MKSRLPTVDENSTLEFAKGKKLNLEDIISPG